MHRLNVRRASTLALALMIAGSSGAAAQEETAASPASDTGPGETVTPIDLASLEWTLGKLPKKVVPDGIATLPNGTIVVIGTKTKGDGERGQALTFVSKDGKKWKSAKLAGKEAIGTEVAPTPDGAVAFFNTMNLKKGIRTEQVASSTDGRKWKNQAKLKRAQVHDVISTPDGLIVAGAKQGPKKVAAEGGMAFPSTATVWTSADGKAWSEVQVGEPFLNMHNVRIAAAPDGTLLLASRVFAQDPNNPDGTIQEYRLYRTEDGSAWDRVQLPGFAPGDSIITTDIKWTPSGFVLAALESFFDPASTLWFTSTDGVDWTRSGQVSFIIESMAVGQPGNFAFIGVPVNPGTFQPVDAEPVAFSSPDGTVWEQIPFDQTAGRAILAAALTPDGRVVLAGTDKKRKPFTLVGTPPMDASTDE